MGVRTGARILTDVVGKNSASAGHLASYAGLSPETWRSESSIRGATPTRQEQPWATDQPWLSTCASAGSEDEIAQTLDQVSGHESATCSPAVDEFGTAQGYAKQFA